jgi:hypothetical protein
VTDAEKREDLAGGDGRSAAAGDAMAHQPKPVDAATHPSKPADAIPPDATPISMSAPSPDVDLGEDAPAIPGEHSGGFHRLPTGPVETTVDSGPSEEPEPEVRWLMPEPERRSGGSLSGWALTVAILGLIASFFVGWCFAIGIVAVILAIVALRRPVESRVVSGWALALGILSLLYSAGWIIWALTHPVS